MDEGLFGIFGDCNSVGTSGDCNSVGTSNESNSQQSSRVLEYQSIRGGNTVLSSPRFLDSENRIILETIRDADLQEQPRTEKRRLTPSYRKLAFKLISFPSVREMDCAEVADLVAANRDDVDEETLEKLAMEVEKLQKKMPALYSPEFVKAVKTAIGSGLLPVMPAKGRLTQAFAKAVNAALQWQCLQGEGDLTIPCRSFAEVLDYGEDSSSAYLYLSKMVKDGFLLLVKKGGAREPSRYRFIGRIIEGVIHPWQWQ